MASVTDSDVVASCPTTRKPVAKQTWARRGMVNGPLHSASHVTLTLSDPQLLRVRYMWTFHPVPAAGSHVVSVRDATRVQGGTSQSRAPSKAPVELWSVKHWGEIWRSHRDRIKNTSAELITCCQILLISHSSTLKENATKKLLIVVGIDPKWFACQQSSFQDTVYNVQNTNLHHMMQNTASHLFIFYLYLTRQVS